MILDKKDFSLSNEGTVKVATEAPWCEDNL